MATREPLSPVSPLASERGPERRRLHQRDIESLYAIAARGGLGRATATTDCIAEGPDHLMYMEGDVLVLLRDSGDELLAFCEGEVGWVQRANITLDYPCASSSSSASSCEAASITNTTVVPGDTRSASSTPSNSIASAQPPFTPGSNYSVHSARSSQSTPKSWPSTPQDVLSGTSDAHEPTLNSSPFLAQDPGRFPSSERHLQLGDAHEMEYKRRQTAPDDHLHEHRDPSPSIQVLDSFAPLRINPKHTATADNHTSTIPPARPSTHHTERRIPREAPPPRSSNKLSTGQGNAPRPTPSRRSSSPPSSPSDYSDVEDDDHMGLDSDLPYAQTGPRGAQLLSTSGSAAMISLSALGVHDTTTEPLSLDSVKRSMRESRPQGRNPVVRHVEHHAGSLAVPVEAEYRQSFAADITRLSQMSSTEYVNEDNGQQASVTEGDNHRTIASLPRSPASHDLNLRPDGRSETQLSPGIDDMDYPVTPGTFGNGPTPSDASSPKQFVKVTLPSTNMKVKSPPVVINGPSPVRRAPSYGSNQHVQVVEWESPRPHPMRKPSSQASVDSGSHAHSTSEETVIVTPQTVPIGAFCDGPSPSVGPGSDLDTGEAVQPDLSMTDPLPPQKELEQVSNTVAKSRPSLTLDPGMGNTLAVDTTSMNSRPDSTISMESRWSMESRAAAKSAQRSEFYELGHSPHLTEPQHQPWRNGTFNGALDKSQQPSPLNSTVSRHDIPKLPIPEPSLPAPRPAAARGVPSARGSEGPEHEKLGTATVRESPRTALPYRQPPAASTAPLVKNAGGAAHQRQVSAPAQWSASASASTSPSHTARMSDSTPAPLASLQQRKRPTAMVVENIVDQNSSPVPPPQQQRKGSGSKVPDVNDAVTASCPATQSQPQSQGRYAIGAIVPTQLLVGDTNNNALPSRNLVRRVTSPTTTSFGDSQTSHRTILPSELLMRQQHQRSREVPTPTYGSSDDNHSYSERSHELHRSMLPNRTASSSDGHSQATRLVSLPSDLFSSSRPSPSRLVNSDSAPRVPPLDFSVGAASSSKPSPLPRRQPSAAGAATNTASNPPRKQASSASSVSDHVEVMTSAPTVTRGRSRSFSAAIAKTLGKKGSRRGQAERPPIPFANTGAKEELVGGSTSLAFGAPMPGFLRTFSNGSSVSSEFGGKPSFESFDSSSSMSRPWLLHTRTGSTSSISKTPFAPAVSHRDYADPTVNADGMEFEIIQPRKVFAETVLVRTSIDSSDYSALATPSTMTENSDVPPELDEWGFLKQYSPTPQIFRSRQTPAEVRAAEQKWLNAIAQPLGHGQSAPKKIRRMVIEQGVPPSLRGRVWEWFMSNGMNGRVGGLFGRLLSDEPGPFDAQIDHDVQTVYSDHSVFYRKDAPGQADLKTLLRAYVHFAPSGYRTDIARLAGALLIHAVLEDAFWLLAGLFNGVLKSYYVLDTQAFIIDLNVFSGILEGSEPRIGHLFRSLGVLPEHYLVKWWSGMFIRSLPWPTVLRLLDVVISEGPRYLMIASLAILTLSRDRLLQLPPTQTAIVDYLRHLPQDSLLLPETFMRACDQVKLRDEDLKKLRKSVKGQMAMRT